MAEAPGERAEMAARQMHGALVKWAFSSDVTLPRWLLKPWSKLTPDVKRVYFHMTEATLDVYARWKPFGKALNEARGEPTPEAAKPQAPTAPATTPSPSTA